MMSNTRKIFAVIAASALIIAGNVVGAPAASASCAGACLAGHDPVVYGCAQSSFVQSPIIDTANKSWGTVYDKYSGQCNTNWAVASLSQDALNHGYSILVDISTQDSNGRQEFMCYPGPDNTGSLTENCSGQHYSGSGYPYTDMVDGTHCTQAYVRLFDASGQAIGYGDVVDPGCP